MKKFFGSTYSDSFVFKISGEENIIARFIAPLKYYVASLSGRNSNSNPQNLSNPTKISFNDLSQLEIEINGKVDETLVYDQKQMQLIATLNDKKNGLIKTFCSTQRKLIPASQNSESRDKIVFQFSPCWDKDDSRANQMMDKDILFIIFIKDDN